MPCCCKTPDHVAVASRANSSVAPKASRMSDRGFEDDKAALQKWREQHSPVQNHVEHPAAAASNMTAIRGSGSSGNDSNSSNSYHLESNENKTPVKLSQQAVQAWQQSPQTPSQPSPQPSNGKLRIRRLLKKELRSPFEVENSDPPSMQGQPRDQQQQQPQQPLQPTNKAGQKKNSAPRSQSVFRTSLLDEEEAVAQVTPDTSPPMPRTFSSSPARSTQRLQKEHYKLDALINSSTASSPNIVRPPSSPAKSSIYRSVPRQHDHEGLRDQLIRDVVLKQQKSSGSGSDHNHKDVDPERFQGQVVLQVHPHDIISPQSTIDNEDTDDYASVSDIFSDPALEDVAISLANDSESRERYILACRLLRARITQPNPPPILDMERELLQGLKDRFQSSRSGGSAVAFEALSKLLAQEDDGVGIIPIVDSRSHSSSSGRRRQQQRTQQYEDDLDVSHDMEGEITVASIHEEETGFNASLTHHRYHHQHYSSTSMQISSWTDEKSTKALSQFQEEEQQEEEYPKTKKSMIRLDGWNSSVAREQYPFEIMGLDQDTPRATRVLTPALMEALRGFFPYSVSEDHFWLKFSLVRDGSSLRALLHKVMASQHTIICVETNDGEVFGSFCSTPWRNNGEPQQKWFGTGEAFLWKVKQSRYVPDNGFTINNEMEVYPYTGHDDMVQYCTSTTLAVGGGAWGDTVCPYPEEPTGIGLLLDGDLEGGETNACATFANPRLYGRGTSKNEFIIQNCEVWTLSPMSTIPSAEQLERQKYFIKEHTESPLRRPDASPRRGKPPLSPRS